MRGGSKVKQLEEQKKIAKLKCGRKELRCSKDGSEGWVCEELGLI